MSDTVQIALITAIATAFPLVIASLVQLVIILRRTDKQDHKLEVIQEKTEEIHVQTNSNLTEQKNMVAGLTKKIEVLLEEKGEAKGKADERANPTK